MKEETELSAREDLKPFSNASVPKEELKEEYSEGEQRQQKQKAFFSELVPKKEAKEDVKEETELSAGEDVKLFSDAIAPEEELKEEYSEGKRRQQKWEVSFSELFQKKEPKEKVKEETELKPKLKYSGGEDRKLFSDAIVPKVEFKEEFSEGVIEPQGKWEAQRRKKNKKWNTVLMK